MIVRKIIIGIIIALEVASLLLPKQQHLQLFTNFVAFIFGNLSRIVVTKKVLEMCHLIYDQHRPRNVS